MKQYIHKIILLIAAIAVFTTGMGVNLVKYCCADCQKEVIFMLGHDCNEIHHHYHNSCCNHEDISSTINHDGHTHDLSSVSSNGCINNDSHCSISRISIDLDSFVFNKPQLVAPVVWLSEVPVLLLKLIPQEILCSNRCEHLEIPPSDPPRAYLSFIRILII